MMSEKRVFAVDLGASGGKCFVGTFAGDGFSMEEIHRFDHGGTSFHLADRTGEITERTYWDDTYIYGNIVEGLHNYRRNVSDHIDAIGIDTWGPTVSSSAPTASCSEKSTATATTCPGFNGW